MGKPPKLQPPRVTNASFNITGTVALGDVVGVMSASGSPSAWRITAGNDGSFTINNSGVISVLSAGTLNGLSADKTYSLTVAATNTRGTGNGMGTIIVARGAVGGGGSGTGGGANPTLPANVDTQPIDGGSTYYATNSFTKATAWPVNIAYPGGTVTYSNGWDDPKFFPLSLWIPSIGHINSAATDTARFLNLGINTAFGVGNPTATILDDFNSAHISVIWPYVYGGQLTTVNRAPGDECTGILMFDEPNLFGNAESATTIPLVGQGAVTLNDCTYPHPSFGAGFVQVAGSITGGSIFFAYNESYQQPDWSGSVSLPAHAYCSNIANGFGGAAGDYDTNSIWNAASPSFSHITCTQAAVAALPNSIIGGRAINVNYAGANGFADPRIKSAVANGLVTIASTMSGPFACQDGRNRQIDATGSDLYSYVIAWYNPDSISNIYTGGGSSGTTYANAAKGSRYGDCIDFMRRICPSPIPITQAIDNCNAMAGVPYDTQPCEFHWAIWSCIIHGARGIIYFNICDSSAINGCSGAGIGDEITNCSFMQSPQSCTFTGTISGSTGTTATLTVASDPAGGKILARGMRATSGVTGGTAIILQQTNNNGPSSPTPGKGTNTTYKIAGTAGNQGPVSMTFKQSQVGFGISAISMAGIGASSSADCGMNDGMKVINDTIRAMAPVINSPFAVAATGGAGKCYVDITTTGLSYSFPSDTGVKNTIAPQNTTFRDAAGIECCTKYYTGSSYSYGSDTISPAFYIFATTRKTADTTATSITFKLNDPLATSVTPIGEGRGNIAVSGGQFTDTFDYAWTVHIYRVNY